MIKKTIVILLFFAIFPSLAFSQQIDKIFERIVNKIKEDNTYLNLYYVEYKADSQKEIGPFTNIPKVDGSKFTFGINNNRNLRYRIVYMPANMELRENVILVVQKVMDYDNIGKGPMGSADATGPVISEFFNFVDIQNLYYNHKKYYDALYDKLDLLIGEDAATKMLNLNFASSGLLKSKGISAVDNEDFLNYKWTNSKYYSPSSIGVASDSGFARGANEDKIVLNFSFDQLTFFYSQYMKFKNNSISVDFNLKNDLLNIQPWSTMVLNAGLRTLIFLDNTNNDIMNEYILDARVSGRFPINTSSIAENLPFLFSEPQKINITSGVNIYLASTRTLGLPFLTFYYSTGSDDFSDPYVTTGNGDSTYAFHSISQWYGTMSFFWNTSEKKNLRMRMDIGVGRHDVYKSFLVNNYSQHQNVKNKFSPYIMFHISFIPVGNELFTTSIRYYDNIFKVDIWFKLFQKDKHVVRTTAYYISPPSYRKQLEWENDGSTFFGFNYRLGF